MGIVLDIIVIAILALCIFLGYRAGLINVGVKLVSSILAIILTIILYQPITNLIINNTQLDEKIEEIILEHTTQEQIENEDGSIGTYIKNYAENIAIEAQNNVAELAARSIAVNVIGIIVMILLFIVIRIGLFFISALANLVANLPILKQFNKAGGILYGILKGLVIVYALLAIIFFASSLNGVDSIVAAIDSSFITKLFYNYNIILNILF